MSAPILQVEKLTKRFGGLTAVHELDFEVREGEILGMIGPNGAGKTTTFNVIAGTYPATGGEVRFAGEPILGLPPHRIASRGVMRTFQHNRPFAGMPVIDNVLVGAHTRFAAGLWSVVLGTARRDEAQRRTRAEELVHFVGLGELREADVATLSFGQGRLLEIARALAGEPRLILFDEPAAGLTPPECARLGEIIRGIAARGIAVLLIEHDMHFLLPLAQRVVVLNFGAKIADGLPHQVRANPAVMDAYLGSHAAAQ
ncbi:MAG TPA: ABC transporter ATP-binding protein [Burkholderiales bacterium]|jgi:ABC-type branched-subunit amino acid transport system ATPase component